MDIRPKLSSMNAAFDSLKSWFKNRRNVLVAPQHKTMILRLQEETQSPVVKEMYDMHYKDLKSGKRVLKHVAPPNSNDIMAVKEYVKTWKGQVDTAYNAFVAAEKAKKEDAKAKKENERLMAEAVAKAALKHREREDPAAAAFAAPDPPPADQDEDEDDPDEEG